VSKVLDSLKKPFDAKGMSLKCSVNQEHKLFGNTEEQIIAIWAETNKIACDKGHIFHEFAELWIKISYTDNEPCEYNIELGNVSCVECTAPFRVQGF
jgi:hypothetical protein